jgi:hypothetical protein
VAYTKSEAAAFEPAELVRLLHEGRRRAASSGKRGNWKCAGRSTSWSRGTRRVEHGHRRPHVALEISKRNARVQALQDFRRAEDRNAPPPRRGWPDSEAHRRPFATRQDFDPVEMVRRLHQMCKRARENWEGRQLEVPAGRQTEAWSAASRRARDSLLMAELRALMRKAAEELGRWDTKSEAAPYAYAYALYTYKLFRSDRCTMGGRKRGSQRVDATAGAIEIVVRGAGRDKSEMPYSSSIDIVSAVVLFLHSKSI